VVGGSPLRHTTIRTTVGDRAKKKPESKVWIEHARRAQKKRGEKEEILGFGYGKKRGRFFRHRREPDSR